MSSLINKIKEKTTASHDDKDENPQEEQQFTIQPHPAVCGHPIYLFLDGLLLSLFVLLEDKRSSRSPVGSSPGVPHAWTCNP